MAVDVCAEISGIVISPRISFSHDLNQADVVPIEQYQRRSDASLLDSSSDFDFCTGKNFTLQEFSPADELFSNGKILPIEVKKRLMATDKSHSHQLKPTDLPPPPPPSPSPTINSIPSSTENSRKMMLKELLSTSSEADENEKPSSRSFWQFRRSSSLNCDNNRTRSLIRPLHFLSRSNSTGSTPIPKQTILPSKDSQKPHLRKQPSVSCSKPPASSNNNTAYHSSSSHQKTPPKKSCRSYGDGVRISPVLNLPPQYISKATVGLFGLGSLFCNGKDKKKKK
ncbi:uncharacterized protein LOC131153258 [Malania oleifera]|uniref:uncharacterized protein LOC131153258 n=1 Tax=Malania oleifera TaxID=397392 RepID=UPI0025AE8CB3|nr:uncharacterized protein LOC131153258 [Malania oleifera]